MSICSFVLIWLKSLYCRGRDFPSAPRIYKDFHRESSAWIERVRVWRAAKERKRNETDRWESEERKLTRAKSRGSSLSGSVLFFPKKKKKKNKNKTPISNSNPIETKASKNRTKKKIHDRNREKERERERRKGAKDETDDRIRDEQRVQENHERRSFHGESVSPISPNDSITKSSLQF